VTPEKLRMIEAAENVLRDLGFYDVRVRHHELSSGVKSLNRLIVESGSGAGASTSLARIEVGPGEMAKFLADGVATRVAEALRGIGYAHVTLDLQGYRRGSTNEALIQLAPTKVRA
jgi:pyridinium-3,5-biscarboxylic acid mononucleotide sulfurtransferase